jgi:hypothetical protein
MSEEPITGGEAERHPPYVIEGARSSRSRCKTCRRRIDQGSLRLGVLVEGPFGPGYLWHHLKCAARHHFDRVEEAYGHEAWKEAREVPKTIPPLFTLRELKEQTEERRRNRKTLPYAERAPSGRSRCRHCGQLIEEGSIRVVLGRGVEFGRQVRTSPINVHPQCVSAALDDDECATPREGFGDALRENSEGVNEDDLAVVLRRIGRA